MIRRQVFCVALVLCAASPLWATDYVDGVVTDLRAAGYDKITVSTTWLGRARIVADSPTFTREVIVDPRTGEILRDYRQAIGAGDREDSTGTGGSGGTDDDGDGSGSGGSGSGSGGSGSGHGGSGHGGSGGGGGDGGGSGGGGADD